MERKKIMNLLDSTQNQPPKIKTKNWVEMIIDEEHIAPIVKLQFQGQVYVIIVMHT